MRLLSRLLKLESKFIKPLPDSFELVLQKDDETSEEAYKRGKLDFPNANRLIVICFVEPKHQ